LEKIIYPIAVIGGGAAGVMAVNRALLNNDQCLFFSGNNNDKRKSRGFWVKKVENIPAHLSYKKGITEPNDEMLQWLKESSFGKNLIQHKKSIIQLQKKSELNYFELIDHENNVYFAKFVVLCTGIMDIQPNIQGSIKPILPYANIQQVDYCLRCDGHHVLGKKVGVIGHSNAAAWVAIMLFERYRPQQISLFTNGEKVVLGEEEKKLLENYEISIESEAIHKIIEDEDKNLKAFEFSEHRKQEVDICFVSLGVIVYNQLALQVAAKVDERGYVITDEFGQSSIEGLYVAGDLRSGKKKQIYTAWDTAVDALDQINAKIRKEKRLENYYGRKKRF
jgi:thioredoxin reductase (NADPH)